MRGGGGRRGHVDDGRGDVSDSEMIAASRLPIEILVCRGRRAAGGRRRHRGQGRRRHGAAHLERSAARTRAKERERS